MRSRIMRPVSLSSSYFFLLPFVISMTATNSSGLMRLGSMSCQMLDMFFLLHISYEPDHDAAHGVRELLY